MASLWGAHGLAAPPSLHHHSHLVQQDLHSLGQQPQHGHPSSEAEEAPCPHGSQYHPLTAAPYPPAPPAPPKASALQRLQRRALRAMRNVPRVPGLLVVALCSISFFYGRFAQQAALLPEPAVLHHSVSGCSRPASICCACLCRLVFASARARARARARGCVCVGGGGVQARRASNAPRGMTCAASAHNHPTPAGGAA